MNTDRPARPGTSMAASRLSTAAEGAARNSTVVVVDDTPANVTVLERLLSKAGVARIHGFTDPRQALARCTESLPDLVLLDLYMPDIDGFAFMEALERLVPDGGFLPVLVLTADISVDIKQAWPPPAGRPRRAGRATRGSLSTAPR